MSLTITVDSADLPIIGWAISCVGCDATTGVLAATEPATRWLLDTARRDQRVAELVGCAQLDFCYGYGVLSERVWLDCVTAGGPPPEVSLHGAGGAAVMDALGIDRGRDGHATVAEFIPRLIEAAALAGAFSATGVTREGRWSDGGLAGTYVVDTLPQLWAVVRFAGARHVDIVWR